MQQPSPADPWQPSPDDARRVGPYRLVRRLGAGGMGVVFLGEDDAGNLAAVKLIKVEYGGSAEYRARLRREVEAARRVPRFCTAPVLAADLDAEPPWIATEYIDGPTLDMALVERDRLSGPALATFAVAVAVALRAIHEHGVIHRDLKPSNILLSPVGPRVIDFGIARVEGADTQLTRTGVLVGTPAYMAPEQLRHEPLTPAVDIFAWASLVTYAANGRPPFGTGTGAMEAILRGQPDLGTLQEPLRSIVTAALAYDPARRPTAADLVDWQARAAPDTTAQVLAVAAAPSQPAPTGRLAEPPPGSAPLPPQPPARGAPRRRWWAGLAAAVATIAAMAVAAFLVLPGYFSGDNPGVAADGRTVAPLRLAGEPPDVGSGPGWEIELAAASEAPFPDIRATAGGLVIDETHGVRTIDPHTGAPRWHWRDEAYRRVATALVDGGATVILALRHDGDQPDRDQVVALDSATGEVRWARWDHDLVGAAAGYGGVVASAEGDWFAAPLTFDTLASPTTVALDAVSGVRLVDGGSGETRWGRPDSSDCRLHSFAPAAPDTLVLVEGCPGPAATPDIWTCRLTGLAADRGEPRWAWPSETGADPSACVATVMPGLVYVPNQDLVIDTRTGDQRWALGPDDEVGIGGDLSPAAMVVGEILVGLAPPPHNEPSTAPWGLILRDVLDGSLRTVVELPAGRPVQVDPGRDGTVVIAQYPTGDGAAEVRLVEVDVASGEVVRQSPAIVPGADAEVRFVHLVTGPETLAVGIMNETGAGDWRLAVHGFG
jgi:hypothetical protein